MPTGKSKMKNYSYIGISFIILIFGIWAIPKIVAKFKKPELAVIGEVPAFQFLNQDRKTISNKDYEGKVYVVEFFFTTCPTICPIMNENMVVLQNEFYGNPAFGIASFTINPAHDTPEVLKAYADRYKITNPSWHLLTGDVNRIYELANTGFNLYAGENPEVEGGFEHSGFFALIDKKGQIRSRVDEHGNPIIYYDGTLDKGIEMLKKDIAILLSE